MRKSKTLAKSLSFIGAAISQGQPIKGVEKTPALMRHAGLFKSISAKYNAQVYDMGDINIQYLIRNNKPFKKSSNIQHHVNNIHLLDPLLKQISNLGQKAISQNPQSILVTVGGDHSIATGSIHSLLKAYPDLRVIWVDAHPDIINPNKSKYPGYHGMPLSHLCGIAKLPGFDWLDCILPKQNFVLIGIRDIDTDEYQTLAQNNIKSFTIQHINQIGIGAVIAQTLKYLDPQQKHPFHISFDVDAVDPSLVKGTGTRFRGGINYRQAMHIVRRTVHQRKLVGLDVVQINQQYDKNYRQVLRGEQQLQQISQSLGLGIDLIQSIFNKYLTL